MAFFNDDAALRVGVIGAGDISDVYLNAIDRSPALKLQAIATRSVESAWEKANARGVAAVSVDAILSDPAVELVVNLAPGSAHDALNMAIIESGKHLYTEKPFSLSFANAQKMMMRADIQGLRAGSAPDTFLGAGHQAARTIVDRGSLDMGSLGQPVIGLSTVGHAGTEYFHPNPAPFYQPGAEPPFDIGPYYLVQWINLLGPVRRVYASARRGLAERQIRRGPQAGTNFPVDIATSYAATLSFDAATVTLVMSLDMAERPAHQNHLYCTEGSIILPDPNFFGGEPIVCRHGADRQTVSIADRPFGANNRAGHTGVAVADYRGVGLVDLAIAIRTGRPHRANGALALHLCEVMEAIMSSSHSGEAVAVSSDCDRPSALDPERDRLLADLMITPW